MDTIVACVAAPVSPTLGDTGFYQEPSDIFPPAPAPWSEALPVLEAYAAITMAVPVLTALVVSTVCAVLFLGMMLLGLGFVGQSLYSALLFVVLAVGSLVARAGGRGLGGLRARRADLVDLEATRRHGLGAEQVGHKARNLARTMDLGAQVAPGWIVTARAFERFARRARLDLGRLDDPEHVERIRAARVPRSLLRRLERRLGAIPAERYLLRSSFCDEDRADRAFPGVYESLEWRRSEGRAGLERALVGVWSSYFGERAVEYRGFEPEDDEAHLMRLAVLVQPVVDHVDTGVASSADPRTGVPERHVVDVATGGRETTAVHDLLTDVVRTLGEVPRAGGLGEAELRRVSRLVGQAEARFGAPVEIEFGFEGDELWIYQVRALTALPVVETFTNSYLTDIPRFPLSTLSASFLWGDDGPVARLGRAMERMGLGRLEPDDARLVDGRLYLRWRRFKPYLVGLAGRASPLRASVMLMARAWRAWRAGAEVEVPPPPPAPGSDVETAELLARLRHMRDRELGELVDRQTRTVQAALMIETLARQSSGDAPLPSPVVRSPLDELGRVGPRAEDRARLAERLWYLTEQEAELSARRVIDDPEGFAARLGAGPAPPAATVAPAPTGGRTVRALVAVRDRLFTERERINVAINALNYRARLHVEELSARLAVLAPGWTVERSHHLALPELEAAFACGADLEALGALAEERAAANRRHRATDPVAVVHVDGDGEVLPESRESLGLSPDALTQGIPLGGGRARGPARVVRPNAWLSPDSVRGGIVILPDPSPVWTPLAAAASGVVFARGGPLSHLALWCRERRIPTVVAARRIVELVTDGDPLEVDGDRGEIRRG